MNAQSGLPASGFPDDVSTEAGHADTGDSPERDHSMDPHIMQSVLSLPSDSEEKESEAVSVKTVSRPGSTAEFHLEKEGVCVEGGGVQQQLKGTKFERAVNCNKCKHECVLESCVHLPFPKPNSKFEPLL